MKKILILVLLCSTLFCQAKDVYFDGMSFEFKSQGMIKLFPREIEADGVSWIFLTINKNIPHNFITFFGICKDILIKINTFSQYFII